MSQSEPNVVWKPHPGSQELSITCPASEILLEGTRGPGKRLADYEPVFTDSGWKLAGDVVQTDRLLAPDGTFTKILGIYKKATGDLYRVTFHDGTFLDVDAEHLWLVKSSRNFKRDGWQVKNTAFLSKSTDTWKIPTLQNPAPGKQWNHPTDPYILGQIVGDGTVRGARVTVYSADDWTRDYFLRSGWNCYQYKPSVRMLVAPMSIGRDYFEFLGRTAVAATKYVPKEILEADGATRLAFLQGLMDSDGCAEKNGSCRFFSVSEELCKGVVTLVQSLGGISSYVWRKREHGISENSLGGKFVLHVNHCGKFNPFRLPRKRDRVNMDKDCVERRIVSIELCGNGPATCFEVAHPSHTFVCKDFIITHNTDAQLMRFRRYVGLGYGRFWRGVIFDREYKNLDDLVSKSQRWFPQFNDGARFHSAKADYKWVWPTGEELLFRSVKRKDDYWDYHGQEFCLSDLECVEIEGLGLTPMALVKVGDRILTPEGYKKITRVFPTVKKQSLLVETFDETGYVGRHIQSSDHKLLNSKKSEFKKLVCSFEHPTSRGDRVSFSYLWSIFHIALTSVHRCRNLESLLRDVFQENRSGSVWSEVDVESFCESFRAIRLEVLKLVQHESSIFQELLKLLPLSDASCQRQSTQHCGSSEFFSRSDLHSLRIQESRSDLSQRRELLEQVLCFDMDHEQRASVSCYLETAIDYQSRSSLGHDLYGESFQPLSNTVQDIALLQRDALKSIRSGLREDVLEDRTPDNLYSQVESYIHPYSRERRVSAVPLRAGRCEVLALGLLPVIDLTVEDCNCYITPNSCTVSSNCFIGWNELTKFPTPDLYDAMLSCNRSSYIPPPGSGMSEIPLTVFSTCNPYGSGHNWVKSRWIDPAPPGKLMRTETEVFNPRKGIREKIVKYRVRLFCSYKENPHLSPEYIAGLENITDENKRKAWLHGDWDVVAGGALDDLWGPHCIAPRFQIPKSWHIDRSMDWGSTHPFSIGWWAEASGEECVLPDGTRWAPIKGSLFRIWEMYGAEDFSSNVGIKMSPTDIADMVVKFDNYLFDTHWISSRVQPGPADNQICDVRDRETATIADLMSSRGVEWLKSDKAAGSRKIGLELIRQRLQNTRTGEGPGIYFMQHCRAAITTLPVLPRDEDDMDDVDTEAADHVYDDVRYRVLAAANRYAQSVQVHNPR